MLRYRVSNTALVVQSSHFQDSSSGYELSTSNSSISCSAASELAAAVVWLPRDTGLDTCRGGDMHEAEEARVGLTQTIVHSGAGHRNGPFSPVAILGST